jgi:hypothetical protein
MCADEAIKRCPNCNQSKLTTEFSSDRSRPTGLDINCRSCTRQRVSAKRGAYIAAGRCSECGSSREGSISRRFCVRCSVVRAGRNTAQSRALRASVLDAYGGPVPKCACCHQSQRQFLTIDHVNSGGRAHRRALGTQGVLRELQREGFPPGYRVLCWNCNMAFGAYGVCPHIGHRRAPKLLAVTITNDAEIVCARKVRRCEAYLPRSAFYPSKLGRDGLQSRSRTCTKEASLERLRAARHEALLHYGGGEISCACCGELEERFMSLDHVDGGGPRRPGTYHGGNTFAAWLKKQGFPRGLRVLCHNCNCAIGKGRTCPHRDPDVSAN